MPLVRPYRRTCRMFVDGSYGGNGSIKYIRKPQYANSPEHYVRGFLMIQKDLKKLFDYVEPADQNLATYSFRIQELLMRACVEVEANCTAILSENGYRRADGRNLTMNDYKKIESSHFLSQYRVLVPNWSGNTGIRTPYANWAAGGSLAWYQSYNTTKHDRHNNFNVATMDALVDAVCGLCALISSQFHAYSFTPVDDVITAGNSMMPGFEPAVGNMFGVSFPDDVPMEERYDFNHQDIEQELNDFPCYGYPAG